MTGTDLTAHEEQQLLELLLLNYLCPHDTEHIDSAEMNIVYLLTELLNEGAIINAVDKLITNILYITRHLSVETYAISFDVYKRTLYITGN